jgi:arginase
MKKIIQACSDLGLRLDGTKLGPSTIMDKYNYTYTDKVISKDTIKDSSDSKLKNLELLNDFNSQLYSVVDNVIKNGDTPITLGGDHSIAIASALASINNFPNIGIIWVDAHGDFNTEDTTESGNIHGMPFAAVTGFNNKEIVPFHKGEFFNKANAVLVGVRSLDDGEIINLKKAGITVFTTNDIKRLGVKEVMTTAFNIANKEGLGVHISYDLDLIDPSVAMGVSVPAVDGISENEAKEIMHYLKSNEDMIKSLDLVEYNPILDKDDKTLELAISLLKIFID